MAALAAVDVRVGADLKPMRAGAQAGERPRVVALVGAECTGKTALAAGLADALGGIWLPELLREFCVREARTPRPEEQAGLMREQIARDAAALARAAREGVGWLILDSTPLVTALYSAMLFGDRSLLAEAIDHQRNYAVTLLAAPDLPWEADGIQRDGPQVRARFHALLVATLAEHGIAHVAIEGQGDARLQAAVRAVCSGYTRDSR